MTARVGSTSIMACNFLEQDMEAYCSQESVPLEEFRSNGAGCQNPCDLNGRPFEWTFVTIRTRATRH
jgi:hypothetical protein